jgi:imidazole glycerol phosphate synthase subunit HisF
MTRKPIIIAAAVALGLVVAATVYAKVIGFAWDANTEPDLAGYKLYCGTTVGGPYTFVKQMTAAELATSNNFGEGRGYCVLTAFDTVGNESGYSNEVTFLVDETPPAAPRNFRLQ